MLEDRGAVLTSSSLTCCKHSSGESVQPGLKSSTARKLIITSLWSEDASASPFPPNLHSHQLFLFCFLFIASQDENFTYGCSHLKFVCVTRSRKTECVCFVEGSWNRTEIMDGGTGASFITAPSVCGVSYHIQKGTSLHLQSLWWDLVLESFWFHFLLLL